MKILRYRYVLVLTLTFFLLVILFAGGYSWWNKANPDRTCASCHEIRPTVAQWQHSAHRDLPCYECHGTALSNGWHSLSEKMGMVFTHVGSSPEQEDIVMTEAQILEMNERCIACHQSEYAKWSAGGHSATYADVFLDEAHNKMEPPYWDCFRCHGMYYEGDINDLMQRPGSTGGPWKMLQHEQAGVITIPCLACHETHTENEPFLSMGVSGLNEGARNPSVSWYIRSDKRHRRADQLLMVKMVDQNGDPIEVSRDPAHKLCLQCHSPNAYHEAGTEDDRTPTGVHEGISCIACHDPHSNGAQNSCTRCHTDVSANCKLDVRMMNTTFFDPESKNNIHFISCTDCHSNQL